jgi:hypothetical protein
MGGRRQEAAPESLRLEHQECAWDLRLDRGALVLQQLKLVDQGVAEL